MNPDRRGGPFGRMRRFSEPAPFQTALLLRFQAAPIRDHVDLPVTDQRRPQRNGNEDRAHQRGDGEDCDCRRDSDRLLPLVPVPSARCMKPRLHIEFVGQYVKVSEAKVKGYPQGGLDAGRCGGKYLPRDRA